jgi:putative FmdB family regulatory protein
MPMYDYFCEKCDKVFESYHPYIDDGQEDCPDCGTMSDRISTTDGIHLRKPRWVPPPKAKRRFGEDRPMPHKRQRWV